MTTLRFVISGESASASRSFQQFADSVNAINRSMAVNKAVMGDSQVQMVRSAALVTDLRNRVADLDRQLGKQRKLAIDDKSASASVARLQVQAKRLQDTLASENIDSRGAARLEASLLTMEATAGGLQRRLRDMGTGPTGLLSRLAFGILGGGGGALPPLAAGGAGAASAAGGTGAAVGVGVGGAALLAGAGGIIPALVSAMAGVASFGVLALPVITKVSAAFDAITSAKTAAQVQKAWAAVPQWMKPVEAGVLSLRTEFSKLAKQLAPVTLQVFADGLRLLKTLLPDLLPFARAAGTAIDGLLKGFDQFARSPGFKTFLSQMLQLTGPAITIIGQGIGQVAVAFGKLLIALANPNALRIAKYLFDGIALAITGVAAAVTWVTATITHNLHQWATMFDDLRHNTAAGADAIIATFDWTRHTVATIWDGMWLNTVGAVIKGTAAVVGWFRKLPGEVGSALASFGRTLLGIARTALTQFWDGLKSVAGGILSWLKTGFLDVIKGIFSAVLRLGSPSALFFDYGRNMMLGLEQGIKAHAHAAITAARGAAEGTAAAAGTGSGGRILGGVVALGQRMAAARGWTGGQWNALFRLWQGESGWNPAARNPSSGAAGIPQDITGSFHGGAAGQIAWGLAYIAGRYGSPAAAYSAWLSRSPHWYGGGLSGGIFDRPTLIGVGDRGAERVDIAPVGSGAARTRPVVQFGDVHIHDSTDPVIIGQKVSWAVVAAGFGS